MSNRIKLVFAFISGIIIAFATVRATSVINGNVIYYNNDASNASVDNVQDAIDDIYIKVNSGTALDREILNNKTALVNGTLITGTMTNNGALGGTINPGERYTIPSGYTSGGTVIANQNQNSGTYKPTTNGTALDMGVNNTYRYIDTTAIYTLGYNSCTAAVSSATKVLLWENPNGTSKTFASQTLALDLTYYKGVVIEIASSNSTPKYNNGFAGKGETTAIYSLNGKYRNVTVNDSGVTFQGIYEPGVGSTSSAYVIPVRIWGV